MQPRSHAATLHSSIAARSVRTRLLASKDTHSVVFGFGFAFSLACYTTATNAATAPTAGSAGCLFVARQFRLSDLNCLAALLAPSQHPRSNTIDLATTRPCHSRCLVTCQGESQGG